MQQLPTGQFIFSIMFENYSRENGSVASQMCASHLPYDIRKKKTPKHQPVNWSAVTAD